MIVNGVAYITVQAVIEIHIREIAARGGMPGIRDLDVLQSAVGQPMSGWGESEFYPTLFDKASVYAFHIAESQPFVDGNKRVALRTALTFLKINNHPIGGEEPRLYDAMIGIAEKRVSREGLAILFKELYDEQNP